MDRGVRNITKFAGWSLRDAVRTATLNPARAVGLAQHGQLVPGAEANLVVMNSNGEVRRTFVRGRAAAN
jgi:N-acetylglucosamine-6-phosphate deacetylase